MAIGLRGKQLQNGRSIAESSRSDGSLPHDNARSQTARLITNLINRFGYDTLNHPPYCSDLALRNYHVYLDELPCWDVFQNQRGAERRGFKLPSQRSGRVVRFKHKKDGTLHANTY
ncbi:hypothetical protein TNCV_3509481 [Trichonephila clavipes]|nr:hypothetical protein TNCV_3509481 [Trichonephila clavipes]